jgi:branched-chain amino acid aminotransferase
MGNFFNYNGKIYNEGAAIIGADNRGLRYGDGLFETIKLKHGQLIFGDEHFDRLWKGMDVLQFKIPKHFTPDFLKQQIFLLTKKNENTVRIRINIFRGDRGLNDTKDNLPNYIIQALPLSDDTGKWNDNGLILGIYKGVKKSCDILSNLKHNNYLPSVMAALHAKEEKWNDSIILNAHHRICETTIANIFFIKGDVIYTPSLGEGCVAGIMRNYLINTIYSSGFKIIEQEISVNKLMTADEVFLTNSIYNIRWVRQIADKKYTNNLTRKIYSSIPSTIL